MRALRPLMLTTVLFAGSLALAQTDPYAARVRSLTDVPYPAFQGVDCTTIQAPLPMVWRLLVGPERAAQWLLTEAPNVVPRSAHYKKGPTASKGDALYVDADTLGGLRRLELTVLVERPPKLLALRLTKDDADILEKGVAQLTYTFVLEEAGKGETDLYWAEHYDADSPFSAALMSVSQVKKRRSRREAGLLTLKALAEAAVRLPAPPLHEVPLTPDTAGLK